MPKQADIAKPDAEYALRKTESQIPEIRRVVPSIGEVNPDHLDKYKDKYYNRGPYYKQSPFNISNYRDQKKRADKVGRPA
jgi:hypothetical protein